VRVTDAELDDVCRQGSRWAQKKGFASEMDLRRTEEDGHLEGADPAKVSKRAKERGRPQIGTLGAGNHFIEVDRVEQVFDSQAAQAMGLLEVTWLQIHCGSRFGHQICTDYVNEFQKVIHKYNITCRTASRSVLRPTRLKESPSAMRVPPIMPCQPAGAGTCPESLRRGSGKVVKTGISPGVRHRP
jgi:RNA-splicing ligase RtcB